jgi:hypothetical protein
MSSSASTFVAALPPFPSSCCSAARQRSLDGRGPLACTLALVLPCVLVALIRGCSFLLGVSRHAGSVEAIATLPALRISMLWSSQQPDASKIRFDDGRRVILSPPGGRGRYVSHTRVSAEEHAPPAAWPLQRAHLAPSFIPFARVLQIGGACAHPALCRQRRVCMQCAVPCRGCFEKASSMCLHLAVHAAFALRRGRSLSREEGSVGNQAFTDRGATCL